MKKILAALVAAAALTAAAPAFGADLGGRSYYKGPPAYAAPLYNWTGFYIGGHVGGAFSGSSDFNGAVLSDSSARVLGGIQAGLDWQFAQNWVLGTEGQYSWLGKSNLTATFPGAYVYTNDQRGLGSVTARLGYTWGPGLLYVKGGYAYSDNNERVTLAGAPIPFLLNGNHSNGWTVGAGLEYMVAPNWAVKGEYMYYDFGTARFASPVALAPFGSFRTDDHTLKLGVNYRFNFASPVAARY
ncbi:outer membrane protein [Bradyrhizobium roseum]|uniref:outer membrane protein n=1 Tax=Bradyrhizobium roseum TaxID=3056648 RepID=UPI002615AA62|nr:outer membrane beta-barrel protein [Bradyrhizobium roseus]WKA29301.1 outer membrane beta-barrel protein [Bradyrhizobium roseus]